jgi:hypothetical protein
MRDKLKNQRIRIGMVALVVGIVGSYLFVTSKAAPPFAGLETEKGTLNGSSVTIQSDSDASGGAYVRFGAVTLSPPVLPKQGVSTGYNIMNRSTVDRQFELDKIKRVFNGHPGFVRVDSTTANQSQLDAVVTDILSRDMIPLLSLHGTTGPRPVDNFGHDQAVKWKGKVAFFEIANEPDLNNWTPDGYADFAKGTGASIKSGNPNAVVISGALFSGGATYKTQDYCRALATRAKGTFQMLSMHLYDDPKSRGAWNTWDMAFPRLFGADSVYKGNTCREILDANGLNNIPIISTESGGPVYKYSETGQNTIIANDFAALKSNLLPSLAVFSMKNDTVPGFGLLRDDNSERPAYTTFMSQAY